MLETITVTTHSRNEMVEITSKVKEIVKKAGVKEGICVLYTPHTTAAITINENADPAVAHDITDFLNKLVPHGAGYKHAEGNADSHIKSTLVAPSITLIIQGGELVLGTWQGIFFCEYDGPRTRKVYVKIMEG